MTATVLVVGKLFRAPEKRMSKSAKPFISATVKSGKGDHVIWWKVLCFSESVGEELLALRDGDGVAVAGSLKVEMFSKDGAEPRLSHTVFADGVLSARRRERERKRVAKPDTRSPAPTGPAPLDDEVPF